MKKRLRDMVDGLRMLGAGFAIGVFACVWFSVDVPLWLGYSAAIVGVVAFVIRYVLPSSLSLWVVKHSNEPFDVGPGVSDKPCDNIKPYEKQHDEL